MYVCLVYLYYRRCQLFDWICRRTKCYSVLHYVAAIGAALALVIVLIGGISGAHVNPAVTITMAAAGKIQNTEILAYCIAQILGGLVALEIYKRTNK